MTSRLSRLSRLVPALIALLTLACSGSSSSPTAPSVAGSVATKVTTPWGSLSLIAGDCGGVDPDRVAASVTDGYERAADVVGSTVDSIRLEGLVMRGSRNLNCAGTAAYGCYYFDRDEIIFRCGYENVVEHELQHRFCDRLKPGCDCYMVDHPGGTDLACQST